MTQSIHVLASVLPPQLAQMLGARQEGDQAADGGHTISPATAEQVRPLLEAARQPKFEQGDILELRPHAHGQFANPKAGERVIVTQVLEKPIHGSTETAGGAKQCDIAIAYHCSHGHILEFLHDSRDFVKVGSIFE